MKELVEKAKTFVSMKFLEDRKCFNISRAHKYYIMLLNELDYKNVESEKIIRSL
jgi:hypothetical protein